MEGSHWCAVVTGIVVGFLACGLTFDTYHWNKIKEMETNAVKLGYAVWRIDPDGTNVRWEWVAPEVKKP